MYRDSIMLEADRQKTTFGYMANWAVEFSQLVEDDAFATFIQVHLSFYLLFPYSMVLSV